ncbi:hypothetical protein JCM10213_006319 [Rhodosporidiobolus nylandii]
MPAEPVPRPSSPAASGTTLAHDQAEELAVPATMPSDVRTGEALEDGRARGETDLANGEAGGTGKKGATSGMAAAGGDLETGKTQTKAVVDIEHLEVEDDPRLWSRRRKNTVLAIISWTAIGATLTGSIYFPALESLQADLHASDQLVAASVSLFIAGQGIFPMCWSAISEVYGRKYAYIVSLCIYIVGTVVCSRAQSISVFLVMRVLQALGSSAVLALGAGTLADMYDTHERGTRLGIFYACPLLGPAAGPLIGGGLAESPSGWRAPFYCLLAYGGVCLVLMVWLPDTFRKERSLAWRKAYDRAKALQKEELARARATLPKEMPGKTGAPAGPATTFSPVVATPSSQQPSGFAPLNKVRTALSAKSGEVKVKIRFNDLNPLAVSGDVIKQPHNLLLLIFSGFLFAGQYAITFSASRTFAAAPYSYSPIEVGLILLSFGVGNVLGSVGGGRYSDVVLARLKAKNGGKGEAEMRLKSTYPALPFLLLFIAYGWLVYFHVHVAGPVVVLFFLGAAIMVIYASTLSYIVDANPGRSTSAIACNSLFRGVLACAASQATEPMIDGIGNGALYSGWGILLLLGEAILVLISLKGQSWREKSQQKEERADERKREQREAKLQAVDGRKA